MIDRECQQWHTRTARRRTGKGLRTFLLNERGDILTGKTKQNEQTTLAAAKRQTLDTHLYTSRFPRAFAAMRLHAPRRPNLKTS